MIHSNLAEKYHFGHLIFVFIARFSFIEFAKMLIELGEAQLSYRLEDSGRKRQVLATCLSHLHYQLHLPSL